MLSARREFLEVFLGALGAAEVVDYAEQRDAVTGAIRFAADAEMVDLSGDDGEDTQYLVWRITEEEAPSVLTYRITDVLERYRLVDVDTVRVSRETLRTILENDAGAPVDAAEFTAALEALCAITVPLVEEGVEIGEVFRIRG